MNISIPILQILVTLMPVILALYLLHFKLTGKKIKNKYRPGTREFKLYSILYGHRFLAIVVLNAFLSIVDLANRFFILPHSRSVGLLVFFVFQMIGGFVVIVMLYRLYTEYKYDGKPRRQDERLERRDWTGLD